MSITPDSEMQVNIFGSCHTLLCSMLSFLSIKCYHYHIYLLKIFQVTLPSARRNLLPGVCVCVCVCVSCSTVSDSVIPWTVAHQAPLSWNSPGQNTEWVAIPFPGALPDPGIEPRSPIVQIVSLSEPRGKPSPGGTPSFVPEKSKLPLGLPWGISGNESACRCRSPRV